MKKKTSVGSKIILTLTMLFFYLPILYIIIFSFNDSRSLTKFGGFSLRWYEKMFADSTMMEAVLYTVIIAVIATVVATVVGTITAIGLSKSRKVVQKMVERINDLPVMNPDIVTAISLLMFFSVLTVKKGFGTLLIAHIMFCIPYVMLSVTPKLRSLDPNLIDAAMDLGATPFQALAKVIVPQIKPGIVSGALIAFTMSFDDFVISYFTTGNGVNNISNFGLHDVQAREPVHQRPFYHCDSSHYTGTRRREHRADRARKARKGWQVLPRREPQGHGGCCRRAGAGRCRRAPWARAFPAAQERRVCREVRQQRFEALSPRRVPRRECHLRL